MPEQAAGNRPLWRRLAITLLHLPLPGLGPLWLGRIGIGLTLLVLTQAATSVVLPPLGLMPTTRDHERFVLLWIAAVVIIILVSLVLSTILVWRECRLDLSPRRFRWHWPYWLAWISIVAVAVLAPDPPIHAYSVSSASMEPTLHAAERVWADQRIGQGLRRGDLVVYVRTGTTAGLGRLMAMGGDRVAMRNGVFILNGKPVLLQPMPTRPGAPAGRILQEQLPSGSHHRVLDLGPRPQDDFDERLVPKGHVFVLGDSRDNSMDSRFEPAMGGPGMVPSENLLGRVFLIYWSRDLGRIGRAP